ncbi:hypothetical protein C8Q74DRAFT_1285648 [Fomes fomentarius]|nr:hypothetical protein C8Q74DRAFT_1285648 [Fomes fomentarius]
MADLATTLPILVNGVPVRIIDKALHFHGASRGSGIQRQTSEIFRFLGSLQGCSLNRRASSPDLRMQTSWLYGDPQDLAAGRRSRNNPRAP